MNHKGYRSQAGNHSCKERHTCPLTDLFAEYGKEEGCHSFEIRFVWKKRAVAKEFIPFHNDHSPVKAAKCAENGSDSSARDAQRRERAHAKDEQKFIMTFTMFPKILLFIIAAVCPKPSWTAWNRVVTDVIKTEITAISP